METFFTVTEQTKIFLWSCVLGVCLGIVYDFFRVLRALKKHSSIAVFLEDLVFVLFYFLVMFIYTMEKSRGEIRLFIYIGSILGFALYFFTAGNLIVNILRKIIRFIKRILKKLYNKFLAPVKRFFVHIIQKYVVETVKDTINENKVITRKKKHLKQFNKMVYNNHKHIQTTSSGRDVKNEKKKDKANKGKKIIYN